MATLLFMSTSFPAGENASPEPPEFEENDPPVAPLDTFVSIVLKKPSRNVTVEPDFENNGYSVEIVYDIIGADIESQQIKFILQPTR